MSAAVVVTGAAGAIGKAICTQVANDGFRVVAVDQDASGLAGLTHIEALETVAGDLRDEETLLEALALSATGSGLAAWVNNAANFPRGRLGDFSRVDLDDALSVNLGAVIHGSRVALQGLLESDGGSLITITSIHARHASRAWAPYAIAKAGAEALMRAVAVDYAEQGVRANSVAPGLILTPGNAAFVEELRQTYAREGRYLRVGAPADVAHAVSFLISDAARHVNGAVIAVDGGEHIASPD
jgi:NAD(P)-dependent dehydrogenase (short-subunit alcohol dehydrogenase family)